MIFLVDNYDSFTHNLAHLFWTQSCELRIERNDKISAADVMAARPRAIVISPGPGRPEDAGISEALIGVAARSGVPVLGVCLGHQAIANVFGGAVTYAQTLMHGKTSQIEHRGRGLFKGLVSPITVTRYHSLVVDRSRLPRALEVDATTEDGVVMAIRHSDLPVFGVQFHPESFMTQHGNILIRNFLDEAGIR